MAGVAALTASVVAWLPGDAAARPARSAADTSSAAAASAPAEPQAGSSSGPARA
jgi:hypothetical protein